MSNKRLISDLKEALSEAVDVDVQITETGFLIQAHDDAGNTQTIDAIGADIDGDGATEYVLTSDTSLVDGTDVSELLNEPAAGDRRWKFDLVDDQTSFDDNIVNHDLTGGDYNLAQANISGSEEFAVAVTSNDGNTFTVTVEWMNSSGTVLFSQSPAEGTNVTSANLNFVTKSDYVSVNIADTSGATSNVIDGTMNAH